MNGKKIRVTLLALVAILLFAIPALAADRIWFDEKTVTVNENESITLFVNRDGVAQDDGMLTWKVDAPKVATVSEDGVLTGVKKGNATVTATYKTVNNKTFRATIAVKVQRPVTKVTLNTDKLSVYYPDDSRVAELLREETEFQTIVVPVKKSIRITATCTPSDATNTRVTATVSDEGIAKLNAEGNQLTAKQAGECDLTIASKLNPEVFEQYHILVIEPVTALTVTGENGRKVVSVGSELQLYAECSPSTASIQDVTWSSRNPGLATVDEVTGVVTGVKKGTAVIEAKAADGSGVVKTIQLTVAQPAESIRMKQPTLDIVAGTSNGRQVSAVVEPNTATDRSVTWSSSDETIATVNAKTGMVVGVSAGSCTVIATSNSNPELSAEMTVNVIQRVKQIVFDRSSLSIPKGESDQVTWEIFPEDASIKDVTLTSSNTKVATVDENGRIYGIAKGSANITAKATDGSGKTGTVKVTVTQPVEGVSMQYNLYHVQLYKNMTVKALIQPNNANNINCNFWTADEQIATVSSKNNSNAASVHGVRRGTTVLYTETEDGGYTATAEIRVADFNNAVQIEDLWIENNRIKIVLRNNSDFTIEKVLFRVECFDDNGEPIVCNKDGVSTYFDGNYPIEMYPYESSVHGKFNFADCVYPEFFGGVRVTILGWDDAEGYQRRANELSLWPVAEWNKTMHHGY